MNQQSAKVILLLVLAIPAAWWISELLQPEVDRQASGKNHPGQLAEQLTVYSYDDTGQVKQKLIAASMLHFQHNDTTELEQPRIWQYNQQTPPWQMEGEQAFIEGGQNTVFMPGEVTIKRSATSMAPAYNIHTSDLTLYNASSEAVTERATRIEQGTQWITAIGMHAWLREPHKLHLLDQVRGHYETE